MHCARIYCVTTLACLLACPVLVVEGAQEYGSSLQVPRVTLDATSLPAEDASPSQGLFMQGLDKAGVGEPLSKLGLNIYGWVEGGYTFNHRHNSQNNAILLPGPFNHEFGNHFMLNQLDVRFERQVDATKGNFDVGGLVEVVYGSDAARMHSTGLGFNGSDTTDDNDPPDANAAGNLDPIWQLDIAQAYVDMAIPVGSGVKLRLGKFVSLVGFESVDPRANPFYSHSYLFSSTLFSQTGVVGFYSINEQLAVVAGISRGWDVTLEDNNGSAIDALGQVTYALNKQWNITMGWIVGPENADDSSHYRTLIDPIITWQATDNLKLGLETQYLYDGGFNGNVPGGGPSHAYGDVWGAAAYVGYTINDYLTANGRLEKVHSLLGGGASSGGTIAALSVYELTLGLTIKPLPKDPLGQNLSIRPEIRYDFSDSDANKPYPAGLNSSGSTRFFKDQLTFAADFIFTF